MRDDKWVRVILATLVVLLVSNCSLARITEQIAGGPESAAREAFEQWVQQAGVPYRDVSYQTLTNDGTYATVQITAYFRESAQADWLEKEGDTECRNVGGNWQCDEWMYFRLTDAEATREAQRRAATATAEAQRRATVATAEAALRTSAGKIAFVSSRVGGWQVYVVNPDGTGLKQLTKIKGEAGDPAVASDGTRIVFVSHEEDKPSDIYVMNIEGTEITNITNNPAEDGWPAWSPDGKKIAFASRRDGNLEIYLMDADGTGVTRLTNDPSDDVAPAFSPDGQRIAFSSNREGTWDIHVMDVDGTGVVRLTNLGDPKGQGWPAWSPDGQRIAFESETQEDNREIYVMNADGTGVLNITNNPAYDGAPTWSPDSKMIAFVSDRDGVLGLYIVKGDGTGLVNLTKTWDWGPSWSLR